MTSDTRRAVEQCEVTQADRDWHGNPVNDFATWVYQEIEKCDPLAALTSEVRHDDQ